MNLLDNVMESNKKFVKPGLFPPLPKNPKKQLAIFTCMDTRLVDFLEPAMGLNRGEAKVIKNAGNTVIHPYGSVIRSLVVAVFLLGVEEIFVIGHRDCGMAGIDEDELKKRMEERGIDIEMLEKQIPDLPQWLGAFDHPAENVERVVSVIRESPLIPKDIPVHGLLFCPNDGHLDVIVRGYRE